MKIYNFLWITSIVIYGILYITSILIISPIRIRYLINHSYYAWIQFPQYTKDPPSTATYGTLQFTFKHEYQNEFEPWIIIYTFYTNAIKVQGLFQDVGVVGQLHTVQIVVPHFRRMCVICILYMKNIYAPNVTQFCHSRHKIVIFNTVTNVI